MINILFVCTGDTCRSAMAEAIMKSKVRLKKVKNVFVDSAGLFVSGDLEMNDCAKLALKNIGIKVPRHKAKQLTDYLMQDFDYIITMTEDQRKMIVNNYLCKGNIQSISSFLGEEEVLDPYGKGDAVYYNTARQLNDYCDKILDKVLKTGERKW